MNVMNIILFVCFFPTIAILYFVMRNEVKPKKNIILGVTLPHDARQDDQVLGICGAYIRRLSIVAAALTLLVVPAFFVPYISVVVTWYMVWIIPVIILPGAVYMSANKQLKAVKAERGWYGESSGVTLIDIKAAVMTKQALSAWLFAPPIIASLLPVVHTLIMRRPDDEYWVRLLVTGTFAALAIAYYFFYRIICRQKAEIIDENTSLTQALTRIRRYNWGKFWLISAWLSGAFNILFWIFINHGAVVIITTLAYSIILIAAALYVEFKTRSLQSKLSEESGRSVYVDEDDKWIYGLFYNNPNDRHLIVNSRVGIGTTMNLGKSSGKVLAAVLSLLIIVLPFFGLWMINEEFTPVRLETSETYIEAIHTSAAYRVDYDEIISAELIYAIPKGTRTNGTALAALLKGSFRLDGIGACKLCLNPQKPPYILIKTADRTYIFGSDKEEETISACQALTSRGLLLEPENAGTAN